MGSVFPIWYTATSRFAPVGGYYGPGGFAELTGMSAIAKLPRKAQDEKTAQRIWPLEDITGVTRTMRTGRRRGPCSCQAVRSVRGQRFDHALCSKTSKVWSFLMDLSLPTARAHIAAHKLNKTTKPRAMRRLSASATNPMTGGPTRKPA